MSPKNPWAKAAFSSHKMLTLAWPSFTKLPPHEMQATVPLPRFANPAPLAAWAPASSQPKPVLSTNTKRDSAMGLARPLVGLPRASTLRNALAVLEPNSGGSMFLINSFEPFGLWHLLFVPLRSLRIPFLVFSLVASSLSVIFLPHALPNTPALLTALLSLASAARSKHFTSKGTASGSVLGSPLHACRPFFYGILRNNQPANPRRAPCLPLRAARAFGGPARAARLSNGLPCLGHR
jgi:hypothetical protein